jgi:hypothetical protein
VSVAFKPVSVAFKPGAAPGLSNVSGITSSGRNRQAGLRELTSHFKLHGKKVTVHDQGPGSLRGLTSIVEGEMLADGKIRYRPPNGPSQDLSVSDFAKLAHVTSNACASVMVEEVPRAKTLFKGLAHLTNNFTLQELRDNLNIANWRQDLLDLLNAAEDGDRKVESYKDAKEWNVRTLAPNLFMTDTMTEQMSHRYAYRVLSCQASVSKEDGLLTDTRIDFHPDTAVRMQNKIQRDHACHRSLRGNAETRACRHRAKTWCSSAVHLCDGQYQHRPLVVRLSISNNSPKSIICRSGT